jgi:hypothetical protein
MYRSWVAGTTIWRRGKERRGQTINLESAARTPLHPPWAPEQWNSSHRSGCVGAGPEACNGLPSFRTVEARMTPEDGDPAVDLSLSPERMMRIRDGVRELLVQHIHALRIASRAFRKAGIHDRARRCEVEANRLTRVVASLDNPMSMLTFPSADDGERRDSGE